ncbi:MAG: DUF4430 domain-containing protein, partial [Propionibacteriaceae bacterium]|nr:DUF4430 domain-containing protein [Propionibacteriaceae bacterium]
SNARTEEVKSQLDAQQAQEFSFGTSGDVVGGTLSIFLSEPWTAGAAEVYRYDTATGAAELVASAALENTPNAIVTFSPTTFKGLFYVVAVPGPQTTDPGAEPSVTATTAGPGNSADPYTSEASAGPKDRYQTDPVPEGKPKPVEPGDVDISDNRNQKATLSIKADTILKHMDQFNKDKLSVLPKNGVVMSLRSIKFASGESVFDVLKRETRSAKIHLEYEWTPMYNSAYVEGINNLYEFDCGELSGWMYKVNGWFPNYGSSRYALKPGDKIEWVYTCDLGRDIGGWWGGMQR